MTSTLLCNLAKAEYFGKLKCWSCGWGGDHLDAIIAVLGLSDDPAGTESSKKAITKAMDWLDGQHQADPIRPPKPVSTHTPPALNVSLLSFAHQAYVERSDAVAVYLANRGLASVMDTFSLGSTDAPNFPLGVLPQRWDAERNHVHTHRNFLNRLIIPYLLTSGDIADVNARALGDQNPKYLKANKPQGSAIKPYLLDMMLDMGAEELWLTEGELDCLSLHAALPGIAACAIPGTQTLSDDYLTQFDGKKVFIVMDNDAAGKAARPELESRLKPYAEVIVQAYVHPDFNDINEMLKIRGRKFSAGYWEAVRKDAVKSKVHRTR